MSSSSGSSSISAVSQALDHVDESNAYRSQSSRPQLPIRPAERYSSSPPSSSPPLPLPARVPSPTRTYPKCKLAITDDTWVHRDEAVARCFADDIPTIQWDRSGGSDKFTLRTFPCVTIELVGVLMYIERDAKRRTYFVDDGSSVMAEVTEKVFFTKEEEATLLAPRPPRFASGVTVRVRASLNVDFRKVCLVLARESDIVEVDAVQETRHIKAVVRLHEEVYPDFDRAAYLESDLLPPPRPKKILVRPPSTTSLRLSTVEQGTTRISSLDVGLPAWSQPSDHHPSASLSMADMSYLSSVAGTQYVLDEKMSSLPDASTVSSSTANEDGLKTYLLDYMRGIVESDWGHDIDLDDGDGDQPPVYRWFKDEMDPSPSRAATFSPSPSWDSSDDDSDEDNQPPPSAQPHPSSSRYSSPPRTSASPPQMTAPPFSLAHLLKVGNIDTYAKKVVQGAILDRLRPPKRPSKPQTRATGSWDRDLEHGLRRGEGKEQVDWTARLKSREQVWKDWREAKRSALVQGALRALVREGEIVVVADDTARAKGAGPSTSTPKRTQHSSHQTSSAPEKELYLPICVPTLGPLVLHLVRVETARVRSTPAGRKIPGIRAPPVWIPTETLLRRLKASHERWNYISTPVLEGVLNKMDDGEWLEESTGRGWKILGS